MLRVVLSSVVLCCFAPTLSAQVRVTVPAKKFTMDQKVVATVENDSDQWITICVESGQISKTGQSVVSSPVPFAIEKRTMREKWAPLLVSPEGGRAGSAVVMEPKKALQYPFWPPATGNLRLQMRYWIGANSNFDCGHPAGETHNAKAAEFSVHPAPKQ
jgi:hypothetical protein